MNSTWDPRQYMKFGTERTQPSIDLVQRIALEAPQTVIDIGCGPGNSTQVLRRRWPGARIVGVDNSEQMIDEARATYPQGIWALGDAATLDPAEQYDLVFSNATLQWVPDHARLVPRLFALVAAGGALAVQVPANHDSPLHQALLAVADSEPWRSYTAGCRGLIEYHEAGFYYDLLRRTSGKLDLWETTYYHEMESHRGLIEWYKGTGMRPYLQSLPDDAMRTVFEEAVLCGCQAGYPVQANGRVLYPFRRIFFVAYR